MQLHYFNISFNKIILIHIFKSFLCLMSYLNVLKVYSTIFTII